MLGLAKNIIILYPFFLLYYFGFGYLFAKFVAKFPEKKIYKGPTRSKEEQRKIFKLDLKSSLINLFLSAIFLGSGIYFKSIGIANNATLSGVMAIDFILMVVAGLFLLDTVIYFTHRWYHTNKIIFRMLHIPHHRTNNPPTVWGTYNENPLGFTLAQCFYAYIVFIIPISIPALIVTNILSMTFDIMGHSNHDVFPRSPLSATIGDHDLHHRHYNHNYAPYFVVWDKLLKTYKE